MRAFPLFPIAATLAALLVLTGCDSATPDAHPQAPGSATPVATDDTGHEGTDHDDMDQPLEDVPPATAPPGSVMPGPHADTLARWDGIGDAQFGMDGEQVKLAWPGELDGFPGEGSNCYHLSPAGDGDLARVAMMFEDGPFVRYSVVNDDLAAPGGGKRGMTVEQIEALYPGRIEQTAHKYVMGGHYLRIPQEGGQHVLLFETDADGIVTGWRVGLPPQVDYVEGCS